MRDRLSLEWATKTEAEQLRLRDGPHPASARRSVEAVHRWLKERSLHNWVQTQNMTKGIAPMQSIVLSHVDSAAVTTEPAAVSNHAHAKKSRRQWLLRWRRRWNVTLATMTAGDVLPPDVAQRKAFRKDRGAK